MNRLVLLILLVVLFVGCSVKLPSSQYASIEKNRNSLNDHKKLLLAKRFIEYWDARIKGDTAKSWQYELPYMRYISTYENYKPMARGYYGKKVVLMRVEPQNKDQAIVLRKVYITPDRYVVKKDQWFYVKDNWYHKFYQAILPPKSAKEAEFQ